MAQKKCCICGEYDDEDEMNLIMGEYSHPECDDKLSRKIGKNVKEDR